MSITDKVRKLQIATSYCSLFCKLRKNLSIALTITVRKDQATTTVRKVFFESETQHTHLTSLEGEGGLKATN